MTLDESIKREQMLTDSNYEMAESCHTDEGVYLKEEGAYRDRAEYHEQLAEWLRELKAYREAREKIQRKANSGQWSDAVIYGLSKATVIINKCLFAHNVRGVKADGKTEDT